jgi:mRNA interferase RelE/StbE
MAYHIEFSEQVSHDLRRLTARERSIVLDAIDAQLVYQPDVATWSRKPLRENPVASWELRLGELRAFYNVEKATATVRIVAVGRKVHNRLFIGGREVQL